MSQNNTDETFLSKCSLPRPRETFISVFGGITEFPPIYRHTDSLYRIEFLLYLLTKRKLENDRLAYPRPGTFFLQGLKRPRTQDTHIPSIGPR